MTMNMIDTNYYSLGDFAPFKRIKTAHETHSYSTEDPLRKQYNNLTSGLNCIGRGLRSKYYLQFFHSSSLYTDPELMVQSCRTVYKPSAKNWVRKQLS
jgi:hypothetical protein